MPARTKYSPEKVKLICKALRQGNTRRAASAAAGIDQDTFGAWLKRHPDFAAQVELAEAQCETSLVAHLINLGHSGDVKAIQFWLERRRPETWGPKQTDSGRELGEALTAAFSRLAGMRPSAPAALGDGSNGNGVVHEAEVVEIEIEPED